MKKQSLYFSKKKQKDTLAGYLFLLPALLSFLLFIGLPMIMAFVLSFGKYNLLQPFEFTGLENLRRLTLDPMAHQALKNTAKYLVVLTPIHCVLGLVLAYFVSQVRNGRIRDVVRSVIYFPTIVTTASVITVWFYMFATDTGFVNYFVRLLGGENIPWMTNKNMYYVTVALFSFWKFIGTTFLYYFVGLRNIPKAYYEAATIDGAGKGKIFFKISLPLLTPTIFFVVVTNMIGVFQTFDEPFFLSNTTNTKSLALYIYESAFVSMKIGYASLLALVLFAIVLVVTIVQFVGQRKWVNYDYE